MNNYYERDYEPPTPRHCGSSAPHGQHVYHSSEPYRANVRHVCTGNLAPDA